MEHKKNSAANTPEKVTLSRAKYEFQQAQLTEPKLQSMASGAAWPCQEASVWNVLGAAPRVSHGSAVSHGK